jgi:hypothetical protein
LGPDSLMKACCVKDSVKILNFDLILFKPMNQKFFTVLLCSLIFSLLISSCSKNSGPTGNGSGSTGGTGNPDTATVPTNVVDMRSESSTISLLLNPYPGYPPETSLIQTLSLGYYYISLGSDTLTFVVQADSSGGGNAGTYGQTSETSVNTFTSGDSLEFLVTFVTYNGPFGGTGTAYYANDLTAGYVLTSTDTANFSDGYGGAQIYYSGLTGGAAYNLYNIEAYIAFRLKNASGSRYGWMLAATAPASNNLLSVYEIAYNKNYNQPLPMGKYQ